MDDMRFLVLRALHALEAEALAAAEPTALLSLDTSAETILTEAKRIAPEMMGRVPSDAELLDALQGLWFAAKVLSWRDGEDAPVPHLEPSYAFGRSVDGGAAGSRRYRSRVAEVVRMLAFNRQRFGLIPATASTRYRYQERQRPQRNVPHGTALAELTGSSADGDMHEAIRIVLAAHQEALGPGLARFQVEAALQVVAGWRPGAVAPPIAVVAGVSSGKTIAFCLPALIIAVWRALRGEGGRVRAIFVYPRATLVEDQHQRLVGWVEAINRCAGRPVLRGAALDAAGKLTAQLEADNLPDAIQAAFGEAGSRFEFVLTTFETLKRRLQNPLSLRVYTEDLDVLALDEVHLLEGLQGSHCVHLLRRIEGLRSSAGLTSVPVRLTASATVAEPDRHTAALFGVEFSSVRIIQPDGQDMEMFGIFHHLFIRTAPRLSALAAVTNGASCLIHNRSDALERTYYRDGVTGPGGRQRPVIADDLRPTPEIEKTIAFVDSLATIGRWTFTMQDNEGAILRDGVRRAEEAGSRRLPYFAWFSEPLWKVPARHGTPEAQELASRLRPVCTACKAGQRVQADPALLHDNPDLFRCLRVGPRSMVEFPFDPIPAPGQPLGSLDLCTFFQEGQCWWFSQDDEREIPWIPDHAYGTTPSERQALEADRARYTTFAGQIRTAAITSRSEGEAGLQQTVDDHFRQSASQIFRLGQQDKALTKRLQDRHAGPWKENFSFLIASPKIEVGVDFSNVRDGVLHRSLRTVASYQQKAGRVGRERLNDSMIVTFMSQSPVEYHYFRNLEKLTDPRHLDPLPLKPENPDVAACHLFMACFDWVAQQGFQLMLVRGPNQLPEKGKPGAVDYTETVRSLAQALDGLEPRLQEHLEALASLSGPEALNHVGPALRHFRRIIAILGYPAAQINPSHSEAWTFASLLQRRENAIPASAMRDIGHGARKLARGVQALQGACLAHGVGEVPLAALERAVAALTDGQARTFVDAVADALQARRALIEALDDVDAPLERQDVLQSAQRVLLDANRLREQVRGLPEPDLTLAAAQVFVQYDNLLGSLGRDAVRDLFYLDALLTRLPYFIGTYPYVLPQTFFEHPRSPRVEVLLPGARSPAHEPRPTALFDLLPGHWTYRFGGAMKVPAGNIHAVRQGEIGLIDLGRAEAEGYISTVVLDREFAPAELPEDFPPELRAIGGTVEIRAPVTVQLKNASDQILVERTRRLAADGDELPRPGNSDEDGPTDTEAGSRYIRPPTLPRSVPRAWLRVRTGGAEGHPVPLSHPVAERLFQSVRFTSDMDVTRFCYGLTRLYGAGVEAPDLFYFDGETGRAVCLGDQMRTDGLVLELPADLIGRTLDRALAPGSTLRTSLMRKALAKFLASECGAGRFAVAAVRRAILAVAVEHAGSYDIGPEVVHNALATGGSDAVVAMVRRDFEARALGRPPAQVEQELSRLPEAEAVAADVVARFMAAERPFDSGYVRQVAGSVLVHTLALKAYQCAIRNGGASGEGLGYFFSSGAGGDRLYLFDGVESGSGLCELIARHFYIAPDRRGGEPHLPSTDFVSDFVGTLGACPSHLVLQTCLEARGEPKPPTLGPGLTDLRADVEHDHASLGCGALFNWLVEQAPVRCRPGHPEDLEMAADLPAVLLQPALAAGVLAGVVPSEAFGLALGGCVSGCPECVLDPSSSIYGQHLTSDHVDNRLASTYLIEALAPANTSIRAAPSLASVVLQSPRRDPATGAVDAPRTAIPSGSGGAM